MAHSVNLSDEAYHAYEARARALGLSVDEYLNRSAPADRFMLTPEMRAGIERGLAEADAGKSLSLAQVRESLSRYRTEWRRERS